MLWMKPILKLQPTSEPRLQDLPSLNSPKSFLETSTGLEIPCEAPHDPCRSFASEICIRTSTRTSPGLVRSAGLILRCTLRSNETVEATTVIWDLSRQAVINRLFTKWTGGKRPTCSSHGNKNVQNFLQNCALFRNSNSETSQHSDPQQSVSCIEVWKALFSRRERWPWTVFPPALELSVSSTFMGHRPLVHPNKDYGPLKKRCNKYLKLGLNHLNSNRNVCKAC